MALFKSIKKYDKFLCKNYKNEFFNFIKNQQFYLYYKNLPRKLENTELVIFDKDGTLIKHEELFSNWIFNLVKNYSELIENVNEMYEYLGFNVDNFSFNSGSIVARGTNENVINAICNFIINNNKSKKSPEEIKEYVIKNWIDIEINEQNLETCGDILKLFKYLKNLNIKIAICTSDDRLPTLKTINLLKINEYVDYLVCGNDNISSKPSPEPIWKICSKLNVNVSNTIMVGDTISDIHAGLNSKCGKIVGVLSGKYNGFDLDEADVILKNIDDIPSVIEINQKVNNNNKLT